eukprot:scaffold65419_cov31-Prasinocladus_malaysianus.AAC.1
MKNQNYNSTKENNKTGSNKSINRYFKWIISSSSSSSSSSLSANSDEYGWPAGQQVINAWHTKTAQKAHAITLVENNATEEQTIHQWAN